MSAALECTKNMPPPLASVFGPLWEDVASLHEEWEVFRRLYMEGQAEVDLMNEVAPGFFHIVQGALLNSIILRVCRLTDPVETRKVKKGQQPELNLVLHS